MNCLYIFKQAYSLILKILNIKMDIAKSWLSDE